MSEIKYEIVKQIGVLFKSSSGWVKVNALWELQSASGEEL